MSAPAPPLELTWVLAAGKRAADIDGKGRYTRNKDRYAKLADAPPNIPDIEGPYGVISAYACRINQSQIRAGFLDYLYYPDIKGSAPSPTEGDMPPTAPVQPE